MRLADVCSQFDVPLTAAALQFAARHPGVSAIVVGARTADEVAANAADMATPLPESLWTALDAALEGADTP